MSTSGQDCPHDPYEMLVHQRRATLLDFASHEGDLRPAEGVRLLSTATGVQRLFAHPLTPALIGLAVLLTCMAALLALGGIDWLLLVALGCVSVVPKLVGALQVKVLAGAALNPGRSRYVAMLDRRFHSALRFLGLRAAAGGAEAAQLYGHLTQLEGTFEAAARAASLLAAGSGRHRQRYHRTGPLTDCDHDTTQCRVDLDLVLTALVARAEICAQLAAAAPGTLTGRTDILPVSLATDAVLGSTAAEFYLQRLRQRNCEPARA